MGAASSELKTAMAKAGVASAPEIQHDFDLHIALEVDAPILLSSDEVGTNPGRNDARTKLEQWTSSRT